MENTELHNRIEKTMASLDSLKRAEANPFLFTRVMEKMKQPAPGIFKKVAIWQMVSCMILVLGLNLAVGFYVFNNDTGQPQTSDSAYFTNHIYTY